MGYEWVIHFVTFLVLVGYRGQHSRYRPCISIMASALTGLCLALTFYSILFPANPWLTVLGFVLLVTVIRCRGNVAKLIRSWRHDFTRHTQ